MSCMLQDLLLLFQRFPLATSDSPRHARDVRRPSKESKIDAFRLSRAPRASRRVVGMGGFVRGKNLHSSPGRDCALLCPVCERQAVGCWAILPKLAATPGRRCVE